MFKGLVNLHSNHKKLQHISALKSTITASFHLSSSVVPGPPSSRNTSPTLRSKSAGHNTFTSDGEVLNALSADKNRPRSSASQCEPSLSPDITYCCLTATTFAGKGQSRFPCSKNLQLTSKRHRQEQEARLLQEESDYVQNAKHCHSCSLNPEASSDYPFCQMLHTIIDGKMFLGTWQSILFFELDGARKRAIFCQIIGE